MLFLTIDHIIEAGFRLLLWILYLYLNQMAPYIRHIEEEELWYYRYPSVPSYIPVMYLYMMMVGVPLIIYILYFICSSSDKKIRDIRNQLYGISLAYGINGIFTAILKLIVGRPRPNFFYRCFPDGVGIEVQNCTGEWAGQMDGRKSFPSAHASFSFTGMVYITCYLFNELDFSEPFFARGVVFFFALVPIICAVAVSMTRACDYHHHFSDIIGGGLMGTGIALLVFYYYQDLNQEKEKKLLANIDRVSRMAELRKTE